MSRLDREAKKKALRNKIQWIKDKNGLSGPLDWDEVVKYTPTWEAMREIQEIENQLRNEH